MTKICSLTFILTLIVSPLGLAQNTGGVFGPTVNEHYSAIQYRSAFDRENNTFAQRLHYEETLNGDFMWRTVVGTRKTRASDFDFEFFQAELFWDLSDDHDRYRTGLRCDLHLNDDHRPHFFGLHWMHQYQLEEDWSLRFLTMSTVDFGQNARDGIFLQARASVTYRFDKHLSLGAEWYDSFGSTEDLLGFSDQINQLGPVANYSFDNGYSVYGGVLFGLSERSSDSQFRLWLTRVF